MILMTEKSTLKYVLVLYQQWAFGE